MQFVAFGGALLFGRIAAPYGAWRTILSSLFMWTGVVTIGFFLPAHQFTLWLALAVPDRRRPGREPGAEPVALQPADPGRP